MATANYNDHVSIKIQGESVSAAMSPLFNGKQKEKEEEINELSVRS